MSGKISFQSLSVDDKHDALERAADRVDSDPYLLEKDIWVVQILKILFDAPFGKDLVFKGGTSLSKAYNAIKRFSEDLDITYDIRAFAPDIVGDSE
ncbi:MAG: nucleotidyl transferase AbiEii/AbiGii toxin family protein, partial [Gammaproteobacteria bacterium]|nr:nucleotidyl transferase AbiEii/AbiGii toxin family protein [Gammaproteobacteria bacterium]